LFMVVMSDFPAQCVGTTYRLTVYLFLGLNIERFLPLHKPQSRMTEVMVTSQFSSL